MSRLQNCWEFSKCGREPGGVHEKELGACPASTIKTADGFLDGRNGGRACVYVTGTYCSGRIQGTHRDKLKACGACDFYRCVKEEHGADCSVLAFAAYVQGKR